MARMDELMLIKKCNERLVTKQEEKNLPGFRERYMHAFWASAMYSNLTGWSKGISAGLIAVTMLST
jgi:hypothetical protein